MLLSKVFFPLGGGELPHQNFWNFFTPPRKNSPSLKINKNIRRSPKPKKAHSRRRHHTVKFFPPRRNNEKKPCYGTCDGNFLLPVPVACYLRIDLVPLSRCLCRCPLPVNSFLVLVQVQCKSFQVKVFVSVQVTSILFRQYRCRCRALSRYECPCPLPAYRFYSGNGGRYGPAVGIWVGAGSRAKLVMGLTPAQR